MIRHIVLFKFKLESKNKDTVKLADELKKFNKKIPGVIDIEWGKNISPEYKGKGYTHGFIMTFKNKEDRDEYLTHPIHVRWGAKYLNPIMEDVLVFDIEDICETT